MKKLIIISILVLSVSPLFAQDKMTEEQKVWMENMTPSWGHKLLATTCGEWKVKITSWMDPKMEPAYSEGTSTSEMVLGGRYVITKLKSNIMGMPYEGSGTDAYDNAKKIFINTWIDNMSTGLMYAEGKYDETTKTLNYEGKMFNPITKIDEKYRETITLVSSNKIIMEMFNYIDNKEYKSMHIEYTK